MKSNKAKMLLAVISLGFCYGSMFNITYLKYILYDPMMEAMQCTNTQLSLMTTVYAIVITIILIPSGIIGDKYKPKKIIIVSAIANGLSCIGYGLSLHNYPLVLFLWVVQAFANGGCFFVCALRAVRIATPADEQGKYFGIFEAFSGISSLLSNFVALALFARCATSYEGIRIAAISMSVWCFLGALLVAIAYKEGAVTDDTEEGTAEPFNIKACLSMLKHPGTYLVTLFIFSCYGFYVSQSYLTPYFTNVLGAAVVFTGSLSIMKQYGLRVVGGPVGGALAQKLHSPAKLGILSHLALVLLMIVIMLIPVGYSGAVALGTVIVLLIALFALMLKGTMWGTMEESGIPAQYSGMAISFATMFGFNTADIFLPMLFGNWLDNMGNNAYSYIFASLIGLCAIGIIAAVIMVIRHKKHFAVQAA